MKYFYLFVMLLSISMTCALANSLDHQTGGGVNVCLSVSYTNERPTDNPPGRTQMRRPVINITENLITVPDLLIGCEMAITSDGITVYTTVVTSTEIILPQSLSGTFDIQFVNETYCFTGEIEL